MLTKSFKLSLIAILLIFFQTSSFSQMEIWTVGTGKTIPEGHLDVSLFRPARYGITRSLEVSAQPFAFLMLFPNGQIKKNWYDRKISIATVHGLNYPTVFLDLVKKRDLENYIPIDTKVPPLYVIKNEAIASKMLKPKTSCEAANYFLSLKIGAQFALKYGESTMPPIYKSIIYTRTSVYHDKLLWYVGADLDAHLNSFINYSVDVDFLSIGIGIDDWAIEHKGMLMTKLTNSLMLLVGYKLAFGTFQEGRGTGFAVYPMADISWTYKFKKKKSKQLQLYEGDRPY